ncbi:NADH:flavin oxidoreductase/NADH oxidase [Orrella sp. JC864]|uniref:NADH:flavin oxidoreductase/NADH oxidase n=1 Tax=Orrella sp. JC864 TaxID=3120298 RepID=UPI003008EED0
MSQLFSPIAIGPHTLPNRIAIAPMCQYSANDGSATDWHMMHLGTLAASGAALLVLEATAVERRGRISHGCLGLYSDDNELALQRVVAACRRYGTARLGVQLAHAGRKGSSHVPWQGGGPLEPEHDAWQTLAPEADDGGRGGPAPHAATQADLDRVREAFVQAARRAERLGLEVIEVHCAHGYLMHEFLSALSNRRTDGYGGDLAGRMRFPLEVFEAVRAAVGPQVAVGARITGSDWLEGGIDEREAGLFAAELEKRGCAYVDVTSGGLLPASIPVGPGYQVPLAAAVKRAVQGMPVRAVGMIVAPAQAEAIIAEGHADMVALARAMLDNPHWPYEAARQLQGSVEYPPQYQRAQPAAWPGAALKQG